MLIETLSPYWKRARTVNTTTNGFPSTIVPTKALGANGADQKPSGIGDAAANTTRGVFDFTSGVHREGAGRNVLRCMPFGNGANDATMSLRIYSWALLIEGGALETAVWVPTLLTEVLCTLSSTFTGVAGGLITASDFFADTLALTTGNDDVSIDIVSPTGNVGAHFVLDFKGGQLVEPTFSTGGNATGCNALVAFY